MPLPNFATITQEPVPPPDDRQPDVATVLHDRARSAGTEYHRFLISLATGVLAAYFIALTGKVEPLLTNPEKMLAIAALCLMGLAVLAGLIGWFADAMHNCFWARALQSTERNERQSLYRARDFWLRALRSGTRLLTGLFVIGIICSLGHKTSRSPRL